MTNRCLKCLKPVKDAHSIHGLHKKCFVAWFDLPRPIDFSEINRESTATSSEGKGKTQRTNDSFFTGKFRKYSANLGRNKFILKVKDESAPELPPLEYLCNQIGATLGLPVADHHYIHFHGEPTFVTKNFMSNRRGNADLKHIWHYIDFNKRALDCETIIDVIGERTKRFSDVETFVYVSLFDSLVGNHDRHARNLGFIVTSKSTGLSPIYDNTSYLGNEKGEFLRVFVRPSWEHLYEEKQGTKDAGLCSRVF